MLNLRCKHTLLLNMHDLSYTMHITGLISNYTKYIYRTINTDIHKMNASTKHILHLNTNINPSERSVTSTNSSFE